MTVGVIRPYIGRIAVARVPGEVHNQVQQQGVEMGPFRQIVEQTTEIVSGVVLGVGEQVEGIAVNDKVYYPDQAGIDINGTEIIIVQYIIAVEPHDPDEFPENP